MAALRLSESLTVARRMSRSVPRRRSIDECRRMFCTPIAQNRLHRTRSQKIAHRTGRLLRPGGAALRHAQAMRAPRPLRGPPRPLHCARAGSSARHSTRRRTSQSRRCLVPAFQGRQQGQVVTPERLQIEQRRLRPTAVSILASPPGVIQASRAARSIMRA
jgi:hypothetical protein